MFHSGTFCRLCGDLDWVGTPFVKIRTISIGFCFLMRVDDLQMSFKQLMKSSRFRVGERGQQLRWGSRSGVRVKERERQFGAEDLPEAKSKETGIPSTAGWNWWSSSGGMRPALAAAQGALWGSATCRSAYLPSLLFSALGVCRNHFVFRLSML